MPFAFDLSLRRVTPLLTDPASWANLVRIASSYVRSTHGRRGSASGQAEVSGLPFALMVEPTNRCNLHCPLCPSGDGRLTRPRGTMERATFDRILSQTKGTVKLLQLWNQGEPLLHPDLPEMIRRAKRQGMFVSTSTNGHPLADPLVAHEIVRSGLDHLIVSVDGATQETYVRYRRGGDLQTVLKGIEHCVEAKRRSRTSWPWIEIQFLVMRHNEHEIVSMERLARKLGVDRLSLKTVQIDVPDQAETFLPSDRKRSRYAPAQGALTTERKRDTCRRLWFSTVINWDGTVTPCCFDKDGRFVLGNVLQESLERIWRGRRYRAFRNAVLRNRADIPMCRNCTEGLRKLFIGRTTIFAN